MAGDWIKLQKDTPDKPEVLAIASRLGIDPDAVVGKLVRIWSWFDTHTTNGNAQCVTYSFIDRICGVTGFAEQVALVGWLVQSGSDLTLPNFDYHNGETAKKRALGKNRTEKHRSNAPSNDGSVTKALPEKRREEKNIKRATTSLPPCPEQSILDAYHDALPELPSAVLMTKSRERLMKSFWQFVLTSKKTDGTMRATNADEAIAWTKAFFLRARDNDFLMGRREQTGTHASWKCDLDFLLGEKGRVQVIEKTMDKS